VDGAGGAAGLDTMAEVRRRAMDPWAFPDPMNSPGKSGRNLGNTVFF